MFVLGIQGSPRKNGNSDYLLTTFLNRAAKFGATTEVIRPGDMDIAPCRELTVCEKKGLCPIQDQMDERGYARLRQADVVVLASPIFFYNVSAQAKIFIDRCQMFWSRKYKLGLKDPDAFHRQGFLLSVAASGGKRLFEGADLTARYFFDAISADYAGSLTYSRVEDAGDIVIRPELEAEIEEAAVHLLSHLAQKPRVLFVTARDACRGQMAAAFAKTVVKGRLYIMSAGLDPAGKPDKAMVEAMARIGLDLKYRMPRPLDTTEAEQDNTRVIFMGSKAEQDAAAHRLKPLNARMIDIPELPGDSPEAYEAMAQQIRSRVSQLMPGLT